MNTSTGGHTEDTHARAHTGGPDYISSGAQCSGVVVTVWRRKACPWSARPGLLPPRPLSESWTCSTQPARTDRQKRGLHGQTHSSPVCWHLGITGPLGLSVQLITGTNQQHTL